MPNRAPTQSYPLDSYTGLVWGPKQPIQCGVPIQGVLAEELHTHVVLGIPEQKNYRRVVLFTVHSSTQSRESVFPEGYQGKNYMCVVLVPVTPCMGTPTGGVWCSRPPPR